MLAPGTLLEFAQVSLPGAPIIGQVDPEGRLVHLGKLEGWWDPPGGTGAKTPRSNAHGVYLGPAYYTERVIQLEARVDGFSQADSYATARRILDAVPLNDLRELTVTENGETWRAQVRQEGDPLILRKGNRVTVNVSLIAPDPLLYSAPSTVFTGLPTTSGGLTLPLVLPLAVGATVSNGSLSINNTGTEDSAPLMVVRGPCPPFTITDGTGRQLSYALPIAAGRTLVLDSANRVALADGTTVRPVTGTWPVLRRGLNQLYFNAASYDPAARLEVTYSSARR